MAKRYRIWLLTFLIAAAAILLWNGNQIHYGISEGKYQMEAELDGMRPFLYFDMQSDPIRFVFGRDLRMSFAYRGTVTLNGRVNLHCENSGEKWVFEVVDNNTLRFVQKESSEFPLKDATLPDGTLFQYVNEE